MQQANPPPKALIFWILWFAILSGLVIIQVVIPASTSPVPASPAPLKYLPVIPLLVSAAIRWLLLPRVTDIQKALGLFIAGLAMAEGCGILGMFVVPEMRPTYLLLAVLGILQFAPFFAAKLGK